jgi:hypothetical protein
LTYKDDEALDAIRYEIDRNRRLKASIQQASQVRDFENVAYILRQLLYTLGRQVDDFVSLVQRVMRRYQHS